MTDLESCAADHESKRFDLGAGYSAHFLPCGGIEIRGDYGDEVLRLTKSQALHLELISRRALAFAKRRQDYDDWATVSVLARCLQSEIDGDTPIHNTDTQSALEDVKRVLSGD